MLILEWTACSGCSGRLKRVLENADGVESVDIVLENRQVTVHHQSAIDPDSIGALIADAGFTVMSEKWRGA